MKRSNFLKSLLISIISPKVVVEALKEDEYSRDYGPIIKLDTCEAVVIKIEQLTEKHPPPEWATHYQFVKTKNLCPMYFTDQLRASL